MTLDYYKAYIRKRPIKKDAFKMKASPMRRQALRQFYSPPSNLNF